MAINLTPELAELEVEDFYCSLPTTDNIRASIKPFGYGLNVDGEILASLKGGANAPIQAQILAPSIDPPVTPLAVHLGQGTVFFAWSHPHPDKVLRYELYIASALTGPYMKFERGVFLTTHGIVSNMPIGRTFYFKLQAVGVNQAISTQVQVKLGSLYTPLVSMKVRAIQGSTIPKGAVFSAVDPETGLLLSIRARNLIQIQ